MKSNVNYTDFKKEFISNRAPDPRKANVKTDDGSDGVLDYFVLPLTYNLGTEDKPRYGEFSLKGPLFSTSGVNRHPNKYKPQNMDYTILISFKPENQEHMRFLKVLDEIYYGVAKLVKNSEAALGIVKRKFNPDACESVFKQFVYTPEDKLGIPIPGKNKSFFLVFYKRGIYKTLLTGRDKKHIEWDTLIDTNLDIYPIITFKWVHIGGEFILKTECKECVVHDFNERKIETSEAEAIDKMNAENPDMLLEMSNKLEKVMSAKQHVQSPLPLTKEVKNNEDNKEPTEVKEESNLLSGINPTDEPQNNLPSTLGTAIANASTKKRQFKIPPVDN